MIITEIVIKKVAISVYEYILWLLQKEFSLIRPIVLESLANKMLFPCTNEGCPKHATLPQLEKHTPHCQHRIINCFMARVYGESTFTNMPNCIYCQICFICIILLLCDVYSYRDIFTVYVSVTYIFKPWECIVTVNDITLLTRIQNSGDILNHLPFAVFELYN